MITRLVKILGFLLGALSALALVLGLYLHATWDGKVAVSYTHLTLPTN